MPILGKKSSKHDVTKLVISHKLSDGFFFCMRRRQIVGREAMESFLAKNDKKCKELWETSRVELIPAAAPLCRGRTVWLC